PLHPALRPPAGHPGSGDPDLRRRRRGARAARAVRARARQALARPAPGPPPPAPPTAPRPADAAQARAGIRTGGPPGARARARLKRAVRFPFSILTPGFLRPYSSVVRLLSERGHEVVLAFPRHQWAAGTHELVGELAGLPGVLVE